MSKYLIKDATLKNLADEIRRETGKSEPLPGASMTDELRTFSDSLTERIVIQDTDLDSLEAELNALDDKEDLTEEIVLQDIDLLSLEAELNGLDSKEDLTEEIVVQDADLAGLEAEVADLENRIQPSGTLSITENGTFDVRYAASVDVDVVSESKLPSLVSVQSADTPYNIAADDLRGATELRTYAFMMSTGLNSVEIPNTVTAIQEGAFYYCTGVSKVVFENGSQMTSLGEGAFTAMAQNGFDLSLGDDSSLVEIGEYALSSSTIKSIDYGKNSQVQTIGDSAFRSCSRLAAIKIPKTITYLGSSAFYGCSNLESVEFEEGLNLTEIKTRTFSNCSKLTELSIPDGVTNLGGYAFSGCSGLEDLVIPVGVTSIGERCFEGCSGLTSITLPASVTSIDTNAFNNCSLLNSVYYEGTLEQWCAITFNSETANPMYYATKLYINGELVEGDLVIPNEVTNINKYAFAGCDSLTSVSMPDGVATIGDSAFSECNNLTNIDMPDSVTAIGSNAFRNCTSLTSITIPSSVTDIPMGVLSGCSNIESLAYPYSTTYQEPIGYIFGNTSYDGSIEVSQHPSSPSILYYIPEKLKSVTITMGDICDNAFYACTSLTNVTINDGVTSIGYRAFNGCTGLTSMVIPDSVTTIRSGAFGGCASLVSVDVSDGVTEIDDAIFYGCKSLVSIAIPDNVTSIGGRAFEYCSGLTNVTFGENSKLTTIDYEAFYECSKLTSIIIPSGVTTIDNLAFANCDSLMSIVIPDSVTNIGNSAFSGDSLVTVHYFGTLEQWCGITFGNDGANPATYANYLYINNELIVGELIVPEGVTNIGTYAFCNWNDVTSVTIPASMSTIGDNAFLGCNGLVEVYNKSSLNIIAGNDDNGKVAYYALNVYTEEGGSKLSTDENGYVIYSGDNEVILVGYVGDETDLIVPENVTSINQFAFYGHNITSIIIPSSVTAIGEKAFYNCYSLITVYNRSSLVIGAGTTTHGYIAYYAIKVVSGTPSETFIFDAEGDEFIVTVKSTGAEIYRDSYHESNMLSAIESVVGDGDYDIELPAPTISLTLTSEETTMPYSTSNSFQFGASTSHIFENKGLMGYRGADSSSDYRWRYSRGGGTETPFGGYGAIMFFGANAGCGKYKIYAYAKISLTFGGVKYVSTGKSEGLEIEIV